MTTPLEKCGWCGRSLPEPGHDAWLIVEDKVGAEKPACTACCRLYKPLIIRMQKEA